MENILLNSSDFSVFTELSDGEQESLLGGRGNSRGNSRGNGRGIAIGNGNRGNVNVAINIGITVQNNIVGAVFGPATISQDNRSTVDQLSAVGQ